MKTVLARSLVSGLTLLALMGCEKSKSVAPSDIYTEKTLFQHTQVSVYQEYINVAVDYYSTGPVTLDGTSDKQVAYIDGNDYPFPESWWNNSVMYSADGSERIGVRLIRESGLVLDSYIQLDGRAQFTAPTENSSINLNRQDLLLEWDSAPHDSQWLRFSGTCIDWTEIELQAGVTNHLLLAGTIGVDSDTDGCAIDVSLKQKVSGIVDDSFAGGTFELIHSPVLSLIVAKD